MSKKEVNGIRATSAYRSLQKITLVLFSYPITLVKLAVYTFQTKKRNHFPLSLSLLLPPHRTQPIHKIPKRTIKPLQIPLPPRCILAHHPLITQRIIPPTRTPHLPTIRRQPKPLNQQPLILWLKSLRLNPHHPLISRKRQRTLPIPLLAPTIPLVHIVVVVDAEAREGLQARVEVGADGDDARVCGYAGEAVEGGGAAVRAGAVAVPAADFEGAAERAVVG